MLWQRKAFRNGRLCTKSRLNQELAVVRAVEDQLFSFFRIQLFFRV